MTSRHTANWVLLVEDDEVGRTELAATLRDWGYDVVAVANGLAGFDELRWEGPPPQCVVMDMRMPVMTGWDLRAAVAANPTLRDIPLIGVTAGRWKPEDALGFAALISKPIDLQQLRAALKKCAAAPPP
jgi:CheY-like chemotaxis protein